MKNQTLIRLLLINCLVLGLLSCSRNFNDLVPAKEEAPKNMELTTALSGGASAPGSNMKIVIPAYFAGTSPLWDTLILNAGLMPPGKLYAIINRFNGPWPAFDSVLNAKICAFRNAGGKVLVYVNTFNYEPFTPRPIDSVKLEVDTWYDWYVDEIDGIFYDQVYPPDGSLATFYRSLYQYAKLQDPYAVVMINPGANTSENYVSYLGNRVSDVICTFENVVGNISWWPFQSWQDNYSSNRFCFLVHTAPEIGDMYYSLNDALSLDYGWFYCTDHVMPNPWDQLPPYLTAMRKAVNELANPCSDPVVTVDGNASEWNNVIPHALGVGSSTVQSFKLANNDSTLFLLIQGTGLNVISNFFLDTDHNDTTGYATGVWRAPNGCDYMIENNVVFQHSGSGWSWNPVDTLSASQFYKSGNTIEAAIPLTSLGMTNCDYIRAGFITNSSGDQLPRMSGALIYRKLKN